MVQQVYFIPKFTGRIQVQTANHTSLLRVIINLFCNGWDNDLACAEAIGKFGSYLS